MITSAAIFIDTNWNLLLFLIALLGEKSMNFVDELNSMPLPKKEKVKSAEELQFEKDFKSAHESIKNACIRNREFCFAKGFLERCTFYDTGVKDDTLVICVDSLYVNDYPYKKEIDYDEYHRAKGNKKEKKSKKARYIEDIELQMDSYRYKGYIEDRSSPISNNKEYCDRLVSGLFDTLKKDGFSNITLITAPVYYAEVIWSEQAISWKQNMYLESGNLSKKVAGYVIQFEVRW